MYDAVVVGNGRRWPCLIVESATDGLTPEQKSGVSQTIVERTTDFYKNLFPHEVIQDPRRVLVVDKGTLPRTKVSCCPQGCFQLSADIKSVGERKHTVRNSWCLETSTD